MNKRELIEKIEASRKTGVPDAQIKQALLNTGWSNQDIEAAISSPGLWLSKRYLFKQLTTAQKILIICLFILFSLLIAGNTYVYVTKDVSVFGSTRIDSLPLINMFY